MNRFHQTFAKPRTFLAVVHALDEDQVLSNVAIAKTEGADGVFLVNHEISPQRLLHVYSQTRRIFPQFWIGLNMLGLDAEEALARMPDMHVGLWTDDAGIRNDGDTSEAERFSAARASSGWEGVYFGGVAMKGQEPIDDPATAARRAIPYMDVVTTSGLCTGEAPLVEKARVMKEAIGDHPLANASGISPENVADFLPYVDCFLVASHVSKSFYELDPRRVRLLADLIGRYA